MQFTPQQRRIYRAISGAVRNVCDAHPDWDIDRRLVSSVAKRATGTLLAQWPEVLAAQPSESIVLRYAKGDVRRGSPRLEGLSLLLQVRNKLALLLTHAQHGGKKDRARELAEALNLLDLLRIEIEGTTETVGAPSGKGSGL